MLEEYMMKYKEAFLDSFPMIPLGWGRTENEVIAIIKECLEKKKDVYELGYIDDDEDILF